MGSYKKFVEDGGLIKLEGWARDGDTNEMIANKIGIARETVSRWKEQYPEFGEVLKKSKEVVDTQVESALLKRALGYTVKEYIDDADGNRRVIEKQMPPDVTAQIFWLKNRKPQNWRDKRDVEIEGKLPVVLKGDDDIAD